MCFERKFYGYQVANAYRLLGDLYQQADDKKAALEAYKKALERNPKIGLKKIIAKLEKEQIDSPV